MTPFVNQHLKAPAQVLRLPLSCENLAIVLGMKILGRVPMQRRFLAYDDSAPISGFADWEWSNGSAVLTL